MREQASYFVLISNIPAEGLPKTVTAPMLVAHSLEASTA
jgi:hypothetical protein